MSAVALAPRLEATLSPPAPLVTIENLEVRFGHVVAVENLSFAVKRGELVSLLGPSGCGKSTLLKTIARLVSPTTGKIVLGDANLRVGFMFQKPLLLPWLTTLDNVLLPIEIQLGGSVVDATDRRRANRMLELVGLSDFAGAYPFQLSGGMQQRAALARALISDPDLLLLDEPFGALDELTREILNEELIRIWKSGETRLHTIMMVTHSIQEAVTMSDRVVVLTGRPARLLEQVEIRQRAAACAGRFGIRSDYQPNSVDDQGRKMKSSILAPLIFALLALAVVAGHCHDRRDPGISAARAECDFCQYRPHPRRSLWRHLRRSARGIPDCQPAGVRLRHPVRRGLRRSRKGYFRSRSPSRPPPSWPSRRCW